MIISLRIRPLLMSLHDSKAQVRAPRSKDQLFWKKENQFIQNGFRLGYDTPRLSISGTILITALDSIKEQLVLLIHEYNPSIVISELKQDRQNNTDYISFQLTPVNSLWEGV